MTTRRGHLEAPFGMFLAFDCFEVRDLGEGGILDRFPVDADRSDCHGTIEKAHHLGQAIDRQNRQIIRHRSFQSVVLRQDHLAIASILDMDGHGQTAGYRFDSTIQRQLPHHNHLLDHFPIKHPHRRQNAHRNGQIDSCPFLSFAEFSRRPTTRGIPFVSS